MRTILLVSLPQHDANLKKQLRETGRKSVLHTDVWRERNEKECWWKKVNKRTRGSKRLERDKKMRILIEPDKTKLFEGANKNILCFPSLNIRVFSRTIVITRGVTRNTKNLILNWLSPIYAVYTRFYGIWTYLDCYNILYVHRNRKIESKNNSD